jgi:carbamoyl-phosphate synthase large subunit
VFPFIKFPKVDPLLGPEMKSTGEVMGVGMSFGEAYAKAQQAAGACLPLRGRVLMSVRDRDKPRLVSIAKNLAERGFDLVATPGTAQALQAAGISCAVVNKVGQGRPHIVDLIKNGEVSLIINTTEGKKAIADSFLIRREALQRQITYTTTLAGAYAICLALDALNTGQVYSLQDLHRTFIGSEQER